MNVEVVDRQRAHRVPRAPLRSFVRRLAAAAPATEAASVTIALCGDRTIRRLNRSFRGKDAPTDVLSFPSGAPASPGGGLHLGDVVISVPQAARQAKAGGRSLAREIRVLAIHGYLHLLGYDHEVDGGTMLRLQARLVGKLLR
jgi:probable rRNA maturation factor